jgi:hypothetical protein
MLTSWFLGAIFWSCRSYWQRFSPSLVCLEMRSLVVQQVVEWPQNGYDVSAGGWKSAKLECPSMGKGRKQRWQVKPKSLSRAGWLVRWPSYRIKLQHFVSAFSCYRKKDKGKHLPLKCWKKNSIPSKNILQRWSEMKTSDKQKPKSLSLTDLEWKEYSRKYIYF